MSLFYVSLVLAWGTQLRRRRAAPASRYNRYNDATLLRFLRARKFDLVKAQEMWAANEEWRKREGVDQLYKYVSDSDEGEVGSSSLPYG